MSLLHVPDVGHLGTTKIDKQIISNSLRSPEPFIANAGVTTVFVVDDEQVIAYTLSVILLKHGYRTFWFTEAICALDAAATHCPALLVTDFNMPSMSGFELADSMRKICPQCRVLVISAQFGIAQSEEILRSQRQAVMMMQKPVGVDVLLGCVAELLTNDKGASESLP